MNISRKRATMMSASVGIALFASLVMPSVAFAAEGDEAPVTPDSSVVEVNAAPQEVAPVIAPAPAPVAGPVNPDPVVPPPAPVVEDVTAAAGAEPTPQADAAGTVQEDSDAIQAPEAARTAPQTETKTETTTPTTPEPKVCTDGFALEWTDVSGENDPKGLYDLSVVELKLLAPFTTCDVSLYGYRTEGPTWETSGNQTPGDFDTVTLTTEQPTATLAVDYEHCYYQNDLAIGKTRFDGVDGALPHYPNSSTPTNLLDHYNGGEACATPPVVAPASLAVSVVVTCGTASITFDNTIEDLKPGQTAEAGMGTYTDANGAIQTVTVQPNSIEVITVRFPEDSGTHIVTAGVKGEVQNAYTVDTNCVPDTYPITPKGVYFHDGCGITDDSYGIEDATKIPGSDETIVVDGVTYYLSAYTANDLSGTYYVNDFTDGDRTVFVAFVPFDRNAVITQPGEDDTYTIGDENVAVWEYTFNSEPCESTTPPTTPKPPVSTPTPSSTPPAVIKPAGGIDTGLFGSDPSASNEEINPFGISALVFMALLASAAVVVILRSRRKTAADISGE